MNPAPLLAASPQGLHCALGGFHVDPWRPVPLAIVTHAHSDHARPGCARYLCGPRGAGVLRARVGEQPEIVELAYGEAYRLGEASVSVHPAGHVLGSVQLRIEHRGDVCVFSGDYKLHLDRTCDAFEPVKCRTFITESTFGLPLYRWRDPRSVQSEILEWWSGNAEAGVATVLFAYSLGKAQRILAALDDSIGPIVVHGAVAPMVRAYEAAGIGFPKWRTADAELPAAEQGRAFVIAPPAVEDSAWLRRFGSTSTGAASGWMQLRGTRRRRNLDRGFALSDHADWPGLLSAIEATGAEEIGVTHGYTEPLVRFLQERGKRAFTLQTSFTGEADVQEAPTP